MDEETDRTFTDTPYCSHVYCIHCIPTETTHDILSGSHDTLQCLLRAETNPYRPSSSAETEAQHPQHPVCPVYVLGDMSSSDLSSSRCNGGLHCD